MRTSRREQAARVTDEIRRSADEDRRQEFVNTFGINVDLPKYPEFVAWDSRILTYATWKPDAPQHPDVLCNSGFFYTGINSYGLFTRTDTQPDKKIGSTAVYGDVQTY